MLRVLCPPPSWLVPPASPSALLSALLLTAPGALPAQVELSGRLEVERPVPEGTPLRFVLAPLGEARRRPSYDQLYEALTTTRLADADGTFAVRVEPGEYALLAFADLDRDGRWDPAGPEPLGWWSEAPGRRPDPVPAHGLLDLETVTLRAPTPFPDGEHRVPNGTLRRLHGYPVLELRGTAAEQGRAQGLLVGAQILDFFRCYMLESKLDVPGYEAFARFLDSEHFAWDPALLAEADAVVEGMRASGLDLHVPELGRGFDRTMLLAVNAYIETRAMRSSCTQFAAWGARTAGTDVDGGTIAGRNMDGELDLRRVTVSHFLLTAVTPAPTASLPRPRRFVSMMWPGFVGTISGFNEDGLHCMENAGGTGPGPVVERMQPISWSMRRFLEGHAPPTPAGFERVLADHANSVGGACNAGCVILCAVPSRTPNAAAPAAWFVEGDRFGHAARLPGAVAPHLPDALLGSNHHLVYGVDPTAPARPFGQLPGFSSRWRYEAGHHKLASWSRTGVRIGTPRMRELLQTVAHGTTEYAVVTRPDQRTFDVAVASLQPEAWDAPYRAWTTFAFEELFSGGEDERESAGR